MKKCRKILSLAVALATVFGTTLSTAAFAEGKGGTGDPGESHTIYVGGKNL